MISGTRACDYLAGSRHAPAVAGATIYGALAYVRAEFGAHVPVTAVDTPGGMAALFRNAVTIIRTGPDVTGACRGNRGGSGCLRGH
ncbi:MAG: hypothetical protein LUQ25_00395, partial [Methanoregulaceae archaeon]|nr:hypothetical protein [Methanoregulaceae archaeon]